MEIQIVETEAEMKTMLDEFMESKKPLTKKDAIAYAKKIISARITKDFKGIVTTWKSLGYRRFKAEDYSKFIKPLINQDLYLVKGMLARAQEVKTLYDLRKLQLQYPVVPPAYYMWKTGIRALAEAIVLQKSNLKRKGKVITNKVEVSK